MLVEMAMSPWFRARAINQNASNTGAGATAANIGVRRLLTPRELEQKTTSLLGWTWGGDEDKKAFWLYDGQNTTLVDQFGIYYGDIDSNGIKTRSRELTSLMANVAEKQAASMACPAVVVDFSRQEKDRLLFNDLSQSTTPATEFEATVDVTPESFEDRQTYSTAGSTGSGEKHAFIAFTNDFYDEEIGDRNLRVVALQVRGPDNIVILEASLRDFDEIEGAAAGCGDANNADYNLWSECRITIPFTASATGTYTVEVSAWGQQAGPDPVMMSIGLEDLSYIDGNSTGAAQIKSKLIDLHKRFLGESLSLGDEELEMSYLLLVETWQKRSNSGLGSWAWTYPNENCEFYDPAHWAADGPGSNAQDDNAMMYTWTTMLIYLMTDFYYLHE
ncbi:MAG: hypothetical protein ACI8Z1_003517 [Candidatus Azotimanducaceae bacterium]